MSSDADTTAASSASACPQCGASNADANRFCNRCGRTLAGDAAAATAGARSRARLVWLAGSCLILAFGVGGLVWMLGDRASNAAPVRLVLWAEAPDAWQFSIEGSDEARS